MATHVLEVDLEIETIKTGNSQILMSKEIPKMKEREMKTWQPFSGV